MALAHSRRARRFCTAVMVLAGLSVALLFSPLGSPVRSRGASSREKRLGAKGAVRGTTAAVSSVRQAIVTRLSDIEAIPVNYEWSGALKQPLIVNGEVPNLTELVVATLAPGDEVHIHAHPSMDEVFFAQEGLGIIQVMGNVVKVGPGTCVHVPAGQLHHIKNTGDEDMVILYFGIETGNDVLA